VLSRLTRYIKLSLTKGLLSRICGLILALAGLLLLTANPIAAEQPAAPGSTGQSERDSSRSATVCEPSAKSFLRSFFSVTATPTLTRLTPKNASDHYPLGIPESNG